MFLRNLNLIRAIKANKEFYLIGVAYIVFSIVLVRIYGIQKKVPNQIVSLLITSFSFFATYLVYYLVQCLIIIRPERPIIHIVNDLRKLERFRILSFILILLFMSAIMVSFAIIKPLIPILNPFSWDEKLAHLDFILHGNDPWKIIHSYLSPTLVTRFLVFAYIFYFYAIFAGVAIYAAAPNSINRRQFILAYPLCWIILGTLFAIIFSSAGPCYYQYVVEEPNKYSELMNYLHSPNTPVNVIVRYQDSLWSAHINNIPDRFFAISAMPSMHISQLCLLVFSIKNHIIKILTIILTVLVSLACVHFGWHYAVDIYAAVIGTYIIWYFVGLYLKRKAGH